MHSFFKMNHFEYYEFKITHPSTNQTTLFYSRSSEGGITYNSDLHGMVEVSQNMCHQINMYTKTCL